MTASVLSRFVTSILSQPSINQRTVFSNKYLSSRQYTPVQYNCPQIDTFKLTTHCNNGGYDNEYTQNFYPNPLSWPHGTDLLYGRGLPGRSEYGWTTPFYTNADACGKATYKNGYATPTRDQIAGIGLYPDPIAQTVEFNASTPCTFNAPVCELNSPGAMAMAVGKYGNGGTDGTWRNDRLRQFLGCAMYLTGVSVGPVAP